MMRRLRTKMTFFLWFAVITFMLFIFLQWGMDFSGRKNGRTSVDTIAKVNGISIKSQTFGEKIAEDVNRVRDSQNLSSLSPLTERIIQENSFEELVQKAIFMTEMDKNKIELTNNEINEIIRNSPPKDVLDDSTMYTNGKFDPQKYLTLLLNPANRMFLYEQEKNIRETFPIRKLQLMYSAGIKVTQTEILKFYQEESLKVKVKYVPFRVEDYLDRVTVTEQELKDYYAIHKDEFKVGEGVNLKEISFEVKPSFADEMEAKREINDIYNLYKNGMNFDTLAINYSQDGNSNKNGGDIGFIKEGELQPDMEKVAFSLNSGKVSKPFQTSLGWQILKVTEIKGRERRISHILIKITPGFETVSGIKDRTENFKTQSKESGFQEAAKLSKLEVNDLVLHKGDGDLVPTIGRIININNFLFNAQQNEQELVGPFVGYDGNLHIFFIEGYIEPRIKSIEEIKDKLVDKAKRQKALELAKQDAQSCLQDIKKGQNITQAASVFLKKPRTTKFFSMKDFIPEVPYSSEFYGLAFTMKEGDIGMTTTTKGVFIIQLLKRKEVDKDKFQKESPSIIVQVFSDKRNSILTYWFQQLRKNAKIEDNRSEVDIY